MQPSWPLPGQYSMDRVLSHHVDDLAGSLSAVDLSPCGRTAECGTLPGGAKGESAESKRSPETVSALKQELERCQLKLKSLQKAITVINHLALEMDIQTAMDNVNDVALELLDCERVTLFLIFESRQELRGKRGKYENYGGSPLIRIKFGEGIAGTVAQTGELMNILDAYAHPLFNRSIDKDTGFRTRDILCCAISDCSGRRVAVLQALNKSGAQAFSQDDEYHLQLVGTHLGNTLSKARLHDQAQREKRRLTELHNTFRHLATAADLGEVLDRVSEAVRQVIHAEFAFIFLVDTPRRELWTHWWDDDNSQGTARLAFGEGIVGRCAEERAACSTSDLVEDDPVLVRLAPILGTQGPPTNMLVQPVFDASSNRVLAAIVAINKREVEGQPDLFFEEHYEESDREACALFALELADILVARSLEVALANALSIVDHNGVNANSSCRRVQLGQSSHSQGSQSCAQLQTQQLMNMYFPIGPDTCSPSSSFAVVNPPSSAFAADKTSNHPAPCRSASLKSIRSAQSGRWQSTRRLSVSPSPPLPSHMAESCCVFFTTETLRDWEHDFTGYDQEDLVKMAYDIFMLSGVVKHFNLSDRRLRAFLSAVASHYNAVPYHNFNHVVHVLHATWLLLESAMALRMLTELDALALLVAAVCHDLDHDGHSNSFQINSQSELSRIYNDVSVMENHHCAMAFTILNKKECDLFESLTCEQQRALRKSIISAILSTDMSSHFKVTQDFRSHGTLYFADEESDRVLLSKVLLHAADIGSAVRPFHINHTMSRRVHLEFQSQAEKEIRQGLPVTFNINATDTVSCSQVELNFLDYVVIPLWERLVEVLPDMAPQLGRLNANRNKYQGLLLEATEVEEGS